MSDEEIGSGYAVRELMRSLQASQTHTDDTLRAKAQERARAWLDVLTNIASGAMKVGERQPHADTPVWVTPQVLRGGFAQAGHFAAGGSLLPHELARAAELGLPLDKATRDALHADSLSQEGILRLASQLAEGAYRIGAPEEAALLVVTWLIEKGEHESVAKLLELICSRFDTLRFYPQPAPPRVERQTSALDAPVLLRTAEEVATSLSQKSPNEGIEAQHESITIWAPMTDGFAAVMLEVFDLESGTQCQNLPSDFAEVRALLLKSYEVARASHTRCKRPHRPGEVLSVLVEGLREHEDPRAAAEGSQRRVRTRLAEFVQRYGKPDSERHRAFRETQAKAHGIPYARFVNVLRERLLGVPRGSGIEDITRMEAPLTQGEANAAKLPTGTPLPRALSARLQAAIEAPLTTHLAEGRIGSSEVLATTLPQLTGPALAKRFDDVKAQRLYADIYRAFKRRRSLLLLWLQHQVRFEELPWVTAMESLSDKSAKQPTRSLLSAFTSLAIETYPSTITPNKLVSELSTLAKAAFDAPLPLVEEIASDIFMGTFTEKYLAAARVAAELLGEDSLYARYYGLPYARVRSMASNEMRFGKSTSAAFDALCAELSDAPEGNPRARNGMIIEQASILTTHNLAVLKNALSLDLPWAFLASRVFNDVLDMLERKVLPEGTPHRARMKSAKNLAFAWRQMLFFLSQASSAEVHQFQGDSHALLLERSALAQERFMPVMRGLDIVVEGGRLARWDPNAPRLLGWSTTRPFLMGPDTRVKP